MFVGQLGPGLEGGGLGFAYLEQREVALRHDEHEAVADVRQQVTDQPTEVLALIGEGVELGQRPSRVAGEDGLRKRKQLALRRQPEHRQHIRLCDVLAAKTDELVERRLGVAHAAFRAARDGEQRPLVDRHLFLAADILEMPGDEIHRDAPEIEALAAGHDCRQHLLRLGGGEHELHVRRRLLERLEQGIERRRGEHVHLVDDVDLEFRRGRRVHTGLAQLTHLLDAVVAGAVDLQHVDRAALGDLVALRIVIGKIDLRPVGAVEALGKNPRQGRLAGSPWPAEQIGVRDSLTTDGVGQRLADVILADDIAEALRTVFPGYDLVRHRR